MLKKLPPLLTDEDAERFVDEADLSEYDLSGGFRMRLIKRGGGAVSEPRAPATDGTVVLTLSKQELDQAIEEAPFDVPGHVGARADGTEEDPLDDRGADGELHESVDLREPRQLGGFVQRPCAHGHEDQWEKDRGDDRCRLPGRVDYRPARERTELLELVQPTSSISAGASSAPSSRRPVAFWNTSSRVGT